MNGSLTTSGTVNNHGTIVQQVFGSLTIGGKFTNSQGALYDIQNDSGIDVLNQGSFVNLGTLRKSGGAGTSTISAPVNNSGGTLEAQTGVLSLTGGGTFTGGVFGATAGAFLDLDTSHIAFSGSFTGSGAGLVRLRNGLTLGPLGATFNFNGQWVNGTWILGDTGLTNSGTLATAGPDNKAFSGLFTNSGTFIHRATGDLQVGYLDFFSDHPGTLNNTTSGVIDFQADSNLSNGTNAPLDYVNNAGIIRKSAGTGSSTIFPAINFTSTAGIFDIRSGTFSLLGGGVFTGGGIFNASAGANLVFAGSPFQPTTMSGAFTGSGAGAVQFSGTSLIVGAAGRHVQLFAGPLPVACNWAEHHFGGEFDELGRHHTGRRGHRRNRERFQQRWHDASCRQRQSGC